MALSAVLGGGAARAQTCAGDCDAGNDVGISEIVRCAGIGLGQLELAACDACDVNGDTQVAVNELVAAVGAALNGCPDPVAPSAVAGFALPETGTPAWGDVPFPSELYRDASGAIRLGALPTGTAEATIHVAMRELVEARDGFCATCNIYFPITGAIDSATLPAGAPPAANDAVILADVDPTSPERGRLFALRGEWNADRGWLAVRPVRGIALHRSRRYAALLTTALRAADGSPLGASDAFRQVRDRRPAAAPALAQAQTVLAPAFDALEQLGIGRNRIVALAAFTTEDVAADVLSVRAVAQDGPPPAVTIADRRLGVQIDTLLGIPAEDRPGIDVPPASGVAGTRAIAHEAVAEVITGQFLAPRVVTGIGSEIGLARRDAGGRLLAGPREPVPFVLTLPGAPAGATVPVVIAHHGFNASRVTGFATANTAARVGVAVLAIDGFQHGERAASAQDEVNALRGIPGPDGFAETNPLDLSGRVFGVIGAAPGLSLFPAYPLGAFLQFAADVMAAVRTVRDGTLLEALHAEGVTGIEAFDAQRIGFIGNSLGAVVGASVLVAEPDVRFAVQNVAPGSIVETLAESPEFRPLVESLFLPLLGVAGPFDEVERHLLFDPIVDTSRWILEPIDPLALAPYLLRHPVRSGGAAEILFQTASLDEVASTLATDSMLAASGTTRATRYDPAAHGMLEVLLQSSRYEPPAAPPFMLRPEAIPVTNPIVAVHDEIAAFLGEHTAP